MRNFVLSGFLKIAFVVMTLLILLGVISAFTASNTMSGSNLGQYNSMTTADDLKPDGCMGIPISTLVSIGDGDSATNGNDLILGTPDRDLFSGLNGNDCILGGAGDDSQYFIFIFLALDGIHGGDGNDVIFGGPGTDILYGEGGDDILDGGEGTDYCIGGGGNNQFIDCELTR